MTRSPASSARTIFMSRCIVTFFDAFEECRTAGRRGSLQEVRQALGPKLVAVNLAEGVNLSDYVVRISQEGPTTFSAVDGARAVRDFWALRELFSAAMVGLEAMGLPDRVLRETFDRIDAVRMDIAESSAVRRSIGAIGADVLARAERIADGLEEEPGVTTGLPGLDRIMLGYRPGELVIIAGRPGMGKTTLATSSALAPLSQACSIWRTWRRIAFQRLIWRASSS